MARAWIVGLVVLAACRGGSPVNDAPDARESPQAKAEPAPLGNVALTSSAERLDPDAGPPPMPLRADAPLSADTVPPPKDPFGLELEATLRTSDLPAAFRGAEVSQPALDAARKRTEARLVIDLFSSRARFILAGDGFVWPADTELRARADKYGHVVLIPGGPQYRIAAPGTLRAFFNERRIDVTPLSPAEVVPKGDGPRRLSYKTRRVDVTNRAASATFEIARIPESSDAGALACRFLLDVMSAPPSTALCASDEVPLHAEIHWTTKGVLTFDVNEATKRIDFASSTFAAPPPSAPFAMPSTPDVRSAVLLSPQDLAALRTQPVDVGPSPDGGSPPPASGLVLTNATDDVRFAWLDGCAVAWLAPGAHVSLPSLVRAHYTLAWRAFLGDAFDPSQVVVTPSGVTLAVPDGGAL